MVYVFSHSHGNTYFAGKAFFRLQSHGIAWSRGTKQMTQFDEILSLLRGIDRRLREIEGLRSPNLTIVAFAERAGVSAKTVSRRIAAGEVVKRNGRVPASELSKFLS